MSAINGLVNQFGQAITRPVPILSTGGAAVGGAQAVGELLIDRLDPPPSPRPIDSKIGSIDSDALKLDYLC